MCIGLVERVGRGLQVFQLASPVKTMLFFSPISKLCWVSGLKCVSPPEELLSLRVRAVFNGDLLAPHTKAE